MKSDYAWSLTNLIQQARIEATQLEHPYIRTEHLLLALLRHWQVDLQDVCAQSGVSIQGWIDQIEALPRPLCGAEVRLVLSVTAQKAIDQVNDAYPQPKPHDVAFVLLRQSPILRRLLSQQGIAVDSFLENLQ